MCTSNCWLVYFITLFFLNNYFSIDDIEDDSVLRRGRPTTHCVYGVPSSINSANHMYFMALHELSSLNNPECVKIFTGIN